MPKQYKSNDNASFCKGDIAELYLHRRQWQDGVVRSVFDYVKANIIDVYQDSVIGLHYLISYDRCSHGNKFATCMVPASSLRSIVPASKIFKPCIAQKILESWEKRRLAENEERSAASTGMDGEAGYVPVTRKVTAIFGTKQSI